MTIVDKILSGDMRAVAQLLRDIEDDIPSTRPILRDLFPHTGKAHIVGLTGPPGAGKSTILDHLTRLYRKENQTVGILAVDPSSPFSGGAVLGDRIRMQRHFLDDGVFIRSVATRGHTGGLTRSADDMIDVLDAMGRDIIFIETVGVGQDEIEIVNSAHTVVLVTVPGTGDDIQLIKAGVMEIGHIFVVNKADRDAGRETARHLRGLLELGSKHPARGRWVPPVIETTASKIQGIEDLRSAIKVHRNYLFTNDSRRDEALRKRARNRFVGAIRDQALKEILRRMEAGGDSLESLVARILSRETDPYTLAREVIEKELTGRDNPSPGTK